MKVNSLVSFCRGVRDPPTGEGGFDEIRNMLKKRKATTRKHGGLSSQDGFRRTKMDAENKQKKITPVQTRYKGYHFRSRLEARWAVLFDNLPMISSWEYEPETFNLGEAGLYLPDFKLLYGSSKSPLWIEVKPDLKSIPQKNWEKIVAFGDQHDMLILDGPPDLRMYLDPFLALEREERDGAKPEFRKPYVLDEKAEDKRRFGTCLVGKNWGPWVYEGHEFIEYSMGRGFMDDYVSAVNAARSARFEWGTSGAT
jgi:hypothetical protein